MDYNFTAPFIIAPAANPGLAHPWQTLTSLARRARWGSSAFLPLIPKGTQTIKDAKLAAEAGVKAICVSNHGGHQLDRAQLPLRTLLEILRYEPDIFEKVGILADGGVHYGTDVLKLLAIDVKIRTSAHRMFCCGFHCLQFSSRCSRVCLILAPECRLSPAQ